MCDGFYFNFASHVGATKNLSPSKRRTIKMMNQIAAVEFAKSEKWRTKKQKLENAEPNRFFQIDMWISTYIAYS